MRHQKRLATGKRIPLERKGTKYITAQSPGPHKMKESVAISVLLRDLLKMADSSREVKVILQARKALINGIARKDHRFPVGFLDEITFTDLSDKYLMIYNNLGKLYLKKIEKNYVRPIKVIGKSTLHKGKTQVNLFTGINILLDKSKDIKVGDSLILEKNKIIKHLKFEKGAKVFLTSGKHVGQNGVVQEIKENKSWTQPKTIVVKTKSEIFETPREYAYVVDGEI